MRYITYNESEQFEIIFYEDSKHRVPVRDFIFSLDIKMRSKLLSYIDLLKERGTDLRLPFSEHLEDGIFELRVKFGSNITRVLYFFASGKRIILTNGFVKKTQKTPRKEIKLAKRRRKDFLERGDEL